MTERSLFWDGNAVLGDDGPYSQTDIQDRFFRSMLNGTGDRGPLQNWWNELEVSGAASPVTVATGVAIVYGMGFVSPIATSVTIPTPSSGLSRYDRIIVRRNWSTQQTRIARLAGTAAAIPAIPALTQSAGAIWEIPLATALVDDAGAITLTDDRTFCQFSTNFPANSVQAGMFAEGAVTADAVPDRTRYKLKGSGSIEPDSSNPCTWTAGAYDHWIFADAATNQGWVYFEGPDDGVGNLVSFYLWSVPDVNGAGGGAENIDWYYSIYYGPEDNVPTNAAGGPIQYDQQARLNTTVYRDLLVANVPVSNGELIAVRVGRDGAADSYNSGVRLLGVEMNWTADS